MNPSTLASLLATAVDQRVARRLGVAPRTMPLLYIEVIKACNLRCRMCGFPGHYPGAGPILTTEQLRTIIADSKQLRTRIVSLGGGEPFLRRDIFDLVDFVATNGQSLHINTNGTRIDDAAAQRLATAGHLHLSLSLDHVDAAANDAIRGDGVWQAVHDANQRLRSQAPTVTRSLNVVVGQHSLGSLRETVRLARAWGVAAIKFQPLHRNLAHRFLPADAARDLDLADDAIDRLAEEALDAREYAVDSGLGTSSAAFVSGFARFWRGRPALDCYAGHVYGNIDPWGQLLPCYDHAEPLDVRTLGLVRAWHSAAMASMRERVRGCENVCWNSGNVEPSLRMVARHHLADPGQLLTDLSLFAA